MWNFIKETICFLIIAILTVVNISIADQHIEIDVRSSKDPERVVGILITPQGPVEKKAVSFIKANDNTLVVAIPLSDSELSSAGLATAMVIEPGGRAIFGDLKAIDRSQGMESDLKLPVCQEKIPTRAQSAAQIYANIGLFESLLQVRQERREVAQIRVAKILSGDFLDKLKNLERGFGFEEAKELSPDLNPSELGARLYRLSAAVDNYQHSKRQGAKDQ